MTCLLLLPREIVKKIDTEQWLQSAGLTPWSQPLITSLTPSRKAKVLLPLVESNTLPVFCRRPVYLIATGKFVSVVNKAPRKMKVSVSGH